MNTKKLNAEVQRSRVETIIEALKLASAFATVAETTKTIERKENSGLFALNVFYSIRDGLIAECSLTESEYTLIQKRLADLEHRLIRLGHNVN